MKKNLIGYNLKVKIIAITSLVAFNIFMGKAQEKNKPDVSVGSDIVSSYIWRGQNCGGVSIQPSIGLSMSGFSLSAWGSVGFESQDTKEFDLTLGYETGGFSIAVTDYWFDYHGADTPYFKYAAHTTSHMFEGTIAYDFGPVALSWNTFFAGNDYKTNDKRAYSTYIEAGVPFKLGGINFAAEVAVSPWEGCYADDFNVVNIGLGASREIRITDSFSIPLSAKIIANPHQDKAYFVLAVSL